MARRPPKSTRTDTLFPYTTLFRSQDQWTALVIQAIWHHGAERETGHGFGMGGEHSTVFLEQQFSCMLGSFNAQIMTPLIKSVWKRSGDWSNVPARLWAVLMCSRATPSQIERPGKGQIGRATWRERVCQDG